MSEIKAVLHMNSSVILVFEEEAEEGQEKFHIRKEDPHED